MRTIEEIEKKKQIFIDAMDTENYDEATANKALVEWVAAISYNISNTRLAEICQAEREGRLVVLPCKVGNTIYVIPSKTNYSLNKISHPEDNRVYEQTVEAIAWYSNDRYLVRTCTGLCEALSDSFGITWFLDKAQAEAALAEMEGK